MEIQVGLAYIDPNGHLLAGLREEGVQIIPGIGECVQLDPRSDVMVIASIVHRYALVEDTMYHNIECHLRAILQGEMPDAVTQPVVAIVEQMSGAQSDRGDVDGNETASQPES